MAKAGSGSGSTVSKAMFEGQTGESFLRFEQTVKLEISNLEIKKGKHAFIPDHLRSLVLNNCLQNSDAQATITELWQGMHGDVQQAKLGYNPSDDLGSAVLMWIRDRHPSVPDVLAVISSRPGYDKLSPGLLQLLAPVLPLLLPC
jgi:hypothetical protein